MGGFRPYLAIGLASVGGAIILAYSTALALAVGPGPDAPYLASWPSRVAEAYASLGILWGFLVLVSALLLFLTPQAHRTLGLVIFFGAFASLFTDLGGLLVGALLAFAGAWAAFWWVLPPEPSIFDDFEETGDASPRTPAHRSRIGRLKLEDELAGERQLSSPRYR